jgi:FAD synthetase
MAKRKSKVMVFGTFDVLHPGHLDFFRQARALGDFLVVSVARDENVKKHKGRPPVFAEEDRRQIVAGLKVVDKAVLGGRAKCLHHIHLEKPDIIALGYDQQAYVKELVAEVKAGRLGVKIVRLKAYQPGKHKSSKYKLLINS